MRTYVFAVAGGLALLVACGRVSDTEAEERFAACDALTDRPDACNTSVHGCVQVYRANEPYPNAGLCRPAAADERSTSCSRSEECGSEMVCVSVEKWRTPSNVWNDTLDPAWVCERR